MKMFFRIPSTSFLMLLFVLLSYSTALAQFPVSIKLDAKSPSQKFTASTQKGLKYRITVSGTYSQWPQYKGQGVDAAYVYSVPQEEINALRWPPKEIIVPIIGTKIKVLDIPHWVGDPTQYPPQNLLDLIPGLQVKIVFRQYLGFRVNGLPIDPAPVFDSVTHRYQIEMIGDGNPFMFQILDSTFNIAQEKVIGRYEDNSGELNVLVEALKTNDINICSLDPIYDNNKKIVGIKLQASILQLDNSTSSGKRNILTDPTQLAIHENGKFICPDSIRCGDRTKSIAAGFVFDRSGSMMGPISEDDNTQRIVASKRAFNNFIDKMQPKDEAMVISFSDTVTVNQTWTSDKNLLKGAVNSLNPDGFTAFNKALINAIDSVRNQKNPQKAIIALTDGANNRPPYGKDVFQKIHELKAGNLPIYVIALGLDRESPEDMRGLDTLKMIADSSKGKLYEVNNAASLDSIYNQLNKDISEDECCTIYFKIAPCKDKSDSIRTITILYPSGDTVAKRTIQYRTDCAEKLVSRVKEDNGEQNSDADAFTVGNPNPNPNKGHTAISYELPNAGKVLITVVDNLGNTVQTVYNSSLERGEYILNVDTRGFAQGIYHAVISLNGVTVSRKMIVAH